MEPLKRKFNVSDLYMLEFSKTMRTHFIDEQAEFSTFDADFANPFETAWETAITDAEAILPDEAVVDQLNQLTADVNLAMEKCRKKFQVSKYFIDKAFPNSTAIRNEFGYNDYDRNRQGQLTLLQFMQTFFKTATKYTAQLAAAGYNAAAVAEIETLANELNDANIAQEKFKGTRQLTTEERIERHNIVWDITLRVSRAGKIIFMNDPAKYQLFLLPASNESGEDISISGTVTNPMANPIEGALVSIEGMGMDTQTDSNGNYAFGNLGSGSYTLNFSATGYAPAVVPGVQVTAGQTTDLDVTLNPDMAVNTTISGTVMSMSTMMPIANAQVSLIVGGNASSTQTNSMGEYVLGLGTLVAPVNGTLQVSAPGHATESRPITVVPGSTLVESFSLMAAP